MLTRSEAPADWAGGWLTIDLAAIVANWCSLRNRAGDAECAAVVKADAYGLGVDQVAPALRDAGCRSFFVAHLAEAIRLRAVLGDAAAIHVLNGIPPGTADMFAAHTLLPVLNAPTQIAEWRTLAQRLGRTLPATLQFDTGMSRFGLSPAEASALQPDHLRGIAVVLAMSHLGCADTPAHPANRQQRDALMRLRERFRFPRWSLAASSGIFLGPDYGFDMVRPGAALYGVPPTADRPNPMRPVVRLQARVVQSRTVPAGAWVGYGACHVAARESRVATLAVGYADGFLRAGGGGSLRAGGGDGPLRAGDGGGPLRAGDGDGVVSLPGHDRLLPIIGRISMDCLAVDVTGVDPALLPDGAALDLIGPDRPLEDAAAAAGTIGYELLTGLGGRYHRSYVRGGVEAATAPA